MNVRPSHVFVPVDEAREVYQAQHLAHMRVDQETKDRFTPAFPVGTMEYAAYADELRRVLNQQITYAGRIIREGVRP